MEYWSSCTINDTRYNQCKGINENIDKNFASWYDNMQYAFRICAWHLVFSRANKIITRNICMQCCSQYCTDQYNYSSANRRVDVDALYYLCYCWYSKCILQLMVTFSTSKAVSFVGHKSTCECVGLVWKVVPQFVLVFGINSHRKWFA